MVKKITGKQFHEALEEKLAVVDFSAKWCGPCKMLEPVLEEVSEELSDEVAFYNVDVDNDQELAMKYGIASIPALVVLKNGEKVDMQVGFQPKNSIVNFIKGQM